MELNNYIKRLGLEIEEVNDKELKIYGQGNRYELIEKFKKLDKNLKKRGYIGYRSYTDGYTIIEYFNKVNK